jgi:hypothetical protein
LSTAVSIETGGAATAQAQPSRGVAEAAAIRRPRWWAELLVVAWLCWLYDAITNLAPLRLHAALAHAQGVLDLERTLHIDPELALDRWLAAHRTLGLVVSDYYDNAHFVVTLGVLGFLWWRRADIYRPLRNSLVVVNLLAFVVFWRYPVAPPRMLAGFTDVVASTHAIGSWHTGALASHANELAAMPSLHVAWAAWCVLAVWQATSRVWVRALVVAHACLTSIAVLATGNHFVLDIVAGLATLAAAVAITRAGERAWRARRAPRTGTARGLTGAPGGLRTACHKLVTKSKTG